MVKIKPKHTQRRWQTDTVLLEGRWSGFFPSLTQEVNVQDELGVSLGKSGLSLVDDVDSGLVDGEQIAHMCGLLLLGEKFLGELCEFELELLDEGGF